MHLVPLVLLWASASPAGPFSIANCSLGCANLGSGPTCTLLEVFETEPLHIAFTVDVDIASIASATVTIVDVSNGQLPAGSYSLLQSDPRVLVFTPAITQLPGGGWTSGFDAGGSPTGFNFSDALQVTFTP